MLRPLRALLIRRTLTILADLLLALRALPALPLVAEEVEYLLDLHKLLPEVVVNDNEGEDVAAIYEYDEPIQQQHDGEGVLQRRGALLLDLKRDVGEDAGEVLREDAGVRVVLGDVVGDVVVLAVEVEGHTDLKGVNDGETRTGGVAGLWGEGVERGEAAAGVVEEEVADEGVEGVAEEQVVDLVLDVVQLAANVAQLLRVDLVGEGDVVGQLAGLRVERLDSDSLSLHGGEVADLAHELLREEEEAGEVDDQPDHCKCANGVDDLPAEDGLLGVLPFLDLGDTDQQVLRIYIEVLPGHLHGILHLLGIILQHACLAVGDIHEVC